MNFNILTTSSFDKELKTLAKKHSSLKDDIKILSNSLKENPTQGVALGKDCYKVRIKISSKKRGKSGGARVITYVKIINSSIYLLSIFDKSEKESLSKIEIEKILKNADL